jgi:glutamate synthase domain-containing protein 3
VLDDWRTARAHFVKEMPRDYKRVVEAEAHAAAEGRPLEFAEMVGVARG